MEHFTLTECKEEAGRMRNQRNKCIEERDALKAEVAALKAENARIMAFVNAPYLEHDPDPDEAALLGSIESPAPDGGEVGK